MCVCLVISVVDDDVSMAENMSIDLVTANEWLINSLWMILS